MLSQMGSLPVNVDVNVDVNANVRIDVYADVYVYVYMASCSACIQGQTRVEWSQS